jgi:hypothetical protein
MAVCSIALLAAGCSGSKAPQVVISADLPPTPSTWPRYPRFSNHSCWARLPGRGVQQAAPSFAPARTAIPPDELVRRFLARLGDRTFIERIELGSPPPRHKTKGFFRARPPPGDALWAHITARKAGLTVSLHPTQEEIGARMLAEWEVDLAMGALRDDFCDAGGRPLVGSSISGVVRGVSDAGEALNQRFPNPSPQAFGMRVAAVGKHYGFHALSIRLLRPRQLAPIVIVRTDRDRKAFVQDVPAVMGLLDPRSSSKNRGAVTFEGFFFEARDARGPFVRVDNVYRGEVMGGQWSWNRCAYPYVHSEPLGAKPCPE